MREPPSPDDRNQNRENQERDCDPNRLLLHLGNIQRNSRDFCDVDHLQGSIDLYAVLRQIILIMQKRGLSIPVCGGRRLLGELRGLEMGIQRMLMD